MNIRWLWFDYVPEDISLTKAQRRRVNRRTWSAVRRKWFIVLIGGLLCTLLATLLFLYSTPRSLHYLSLFPLVLVIELGLVTAGWVFARPEVFRALREVGVKVCPKCGYDLRGQSGDSCPECGWTASDDPDHAG